MYSALDLNKVLHQLNENWQTLQQIEINLSPEQYPT